MKGINSMKIKRIALSLAVCTMLAGVACTETDVAELDSASSCLDAASAHMDVYEAKNLGRSASDIASLESTARRLDAECDAKKNHELDLKTGN